jgi:hypothetical protein
MGKEDIREKTNGLDEPVRSNYVDVFKKTYHRVAFNIVTLYIHRYQHVSQLHTHPGLKNAAQFIIQELCPKSCEVSVFDKGRLKCALALLATDHNERRKRAREVADYFNKQNSRSFLVFPYHEFQYQEIHEKFMQLANY